MKYLLLLVLLSITLSGFSQRVYYFDTIYFKSGSSRVSVTAKQKLQKKIQILIDKKIVSVGIEGHSDRKGNAVNNKKLSLKRAQAVKAFLQETGVNINPTISARGSQMPIHAYSLSRNRRVQLTIITAIPEEHDATATPIVDDRYTLERLLAELRPPTQDFILNPYKDTVIRLTEGTVLYFRANSLQIDGSCTSVVLKTAEAYSNEAILLNNMHTMSNGEELVSQAMVFTEFSCNGTPLAFKPGKNMTIFTPTDTVRTDVLLYKWDTLGPNHFNWRTDSTRPDVLRGFMPECGNLGNCFTPDIDCNTSCPLLFCRTNRFFKGIFSREQRDSNRIWRRCKKRKRDYEKMIANLSPAQKAGIDSFKQQLGGWPVNPQSLNTKCIPFLSVLKKYDIKNGEDLKKAMEKEIWSNAGNQNFDTSSTVKRKPHPSDKLGMLDYYVFNITANGWTNVDWCASIPPEQKALLTATRPDSLDGLLKVIYTKRRSVIQANSQHNQFGYKYAMHEGAYWIFIGINNTTGKPVMEYGKLPDRNIDIKLMPATVTVSEIATQLKKLGSWQ